MKEETPILYPNTMLGASVSTYAKTHTTGVPEHVIEYYEHVQATEPMANYMVSISQAQAMLFIAKTVGAKRSESPCARKRNLQTPG